MELHFSYTLAAALAIALQIQQVAAQPSLTCRRRGFHDVINDFISIQSDKRAFDQLKFKAQVCRNIPRPVRLHKEPQRFQLVNQRKFYAYSAYFDEREKAGGPAIRVIGAGLQLQFHDVGDFYCQMWFEGRPHPVSVGPGEYKYIYPSTMHAEQWTSHFIVCPLPPLYNSTLPYMVSVTPRSCAQPNNFLLVGGSLWHPKRLGHALCISPLYNHFSQWEAIVEVFEIHKILGAAGITVYNFSSTQQTGKTLQSYLRDGDGSVTVVQWPFPGVNANVFFQRGALNDCYYRNRGRYEYITVTDMDEILVPRSHDTWPQLLAAISKPDIGTYSFQHAYFRRNITLKVSPQLITQSSFYRTEKVEPPGKIRCKSLHHADNIICIDLHFACELLPGKREYMLPPEEGILHHYRPSPMEYFWKYPERYTFVEDRFMEKYKNPLNKAYLKRLQLIG